MAIKETYRLYTLSAGIYTSLKSNIVMTHDPNNHWRLEPGGSILFQWLVMYVWGPPFHQSIEQ